MAWCRNNWATSSCLVSLCNRYFAKFITSVLLWAYILSEKFNILCYKPVKPCYLLLQTPPIVKLPPCCNSFACTVHKNNNKVIKNRSFHWMKSLDKEKTCPYYRKPSPSQYRRARLLHQKSRIFYSASMSFERISHCRVVPVASWLCEVLSWKFF